MGFSGGGSNVLLPHQHDGRVSQDGGPLDFNSITQSQSAQGEVFYSDGTALQQLAYPGVPAGETLTATALSTAPSWVAAAGGSLYEKIGETILGAPAASIDVTFAAVNQTDISKIAVVFNGEKTTTNSVFYLKINSLAANYDGALLQQASAPPTGYGYTGATQGWTVHTNNAGDEFLINAYVTCNASSDHIQAQVTSVTENHTMLSRGFNTTAAQTSIDKIEFYPSAGNIDTGSILSVYKILL